MSGGKRHIFRCDRCGQTIRAGEAYKVEPRLVDRLNSRGRRFVTWEKPTYHLDQETCARRRAA
jgi:hypothetical protein